MRIHPFSPLIAIFLLITISAILFLFNSFTSIAKVSTLGASVIASLGAPSGIAQQHQKYITELETFIEGESFDEKSFGDLMNNLVNASYDASLSQAALDKINIALQLAPRNSTLHQSAFLAQAYLQVKLGQEEGEQNFSERTICVSTCFIR